MEIWKDIKDYEGLYQISSYGRVKSLNYKRTGKEKILKYKTEDNGYLRVILSKNNKIKTYLIHRLVALAFIPNPNVLPQINHINEDKADNRVENLEWCDRKYNCNYGTRNNKISKAQSGKKAILQFTLDGDFIKCWDCGFDIMRELGIDNRLVSSCCNGNKKTTYGYIWKHAKDYEKIPFKVFDLTIYKKIN